MCTLPSHCLTSLLLPLLIAIGVYFILLDILTDLVHSDKCPFFKMKNSDIYIRTNIPLSSTKNNKERSGSVVECLTRAREVRASPTSLVTALWSLSKTHLS